MYLKTLVEYLDQVLGISDFPEDSSLNGLQVEGASLVKEATLAVDACYKSIQKTSKKRADILIVHHGLFWGDRTPITGITAKRVRVLLKNGISLYAAHLPLDCHSRIGNNARLADMLNVRDREPFGEYHGKMIGLTGTLSRSLTVRGLCRKMDLLLDTKTKSFDFGPGEIERIAIVSGDGAALAPQAAESGAQALLTGEPSHATYHIASEYKINLICAGHYATETTGIRALGEKIQNEFKLPVSFLDIPTGL
jgi:dinuclear metal center YbgI/SA1388 family protein